MNLDKCMMKLSCMGAALQTFLPISAAMHWCWKKVVARVCPIHWISMTCPNSYGMQRLSLSRAVCCWRKIVKVTISSVIGDSGSAICLFRIVWKSCASLIDGDEILGGWSQNALSLTIAGQIQVRYVETTPYYLCRHGSFEVSVNLH